MPTIEVKAISDYGLPWNKDIRSGSEEPSLCFPAQTIDNKSLTPVAVANFAAFG